MMLVLMMAVVVTMEVFMVCCLVRMSVAVRF